MSTANELRTMHDGKRRRHRVETFAIRNGLILASCDYNRYPELPGGGVDNGENIAAAGKRELEEEAGWESKDYNIVTLDHDWVWSGDVNSTDRWLLSLGCVEEQFYAVTCVPLRFKPTPLYGSAGDALEFEMVSMDRVYQDTKIHLERGMLPRRRMQAEFRLHVLELLMANATV